MILDTHWQQPFIYSKLRWFRGRHGATPQKPIGGTGQMLGPPGLQAAAAKPHQAVYLGFDRASLLEGEGKPVYSLLAWVGHQANLRDLFPTRKVFPTSIKEINAMNWGSGPSIPNTSMRSTSK